MIGEQLVSIVELVSSTTAATAVLKPPGAAISMSNVNSNSLSPTAAWYTWSTINKTLLQSKTLLYIQQFVRKAS
jgi:hypothetical protein